MARSKLLLAYKNLSRSALLNYARYGATVASDQHHFTQLVAFLPSALWNWISSYVSHLLHGRVDLPGVSTAPNGTSQYVIRNDACIGIAADWGTGTDEAFLVTRQLSKRIDDPSKLVDLTLHLGDIYYVGEISEVRKNCLLGQNPTGLPVDPDDHTDYSPNDCVEWLHGADGSLALCGNHEMYSGGGGFYDLFLKTLGMHSVGTPAPGQGCGYFCLENDFWRIIGLDTGYNSTGLPIISPADTRDCTLPDQLVSWLTTLFQTAAPKATILLSHHQYYSAFEEQYLKPAQQLKSILPNNPVLWFWGHEHRLAGYDLFGPDQLQAFGRCIGNGGMPDAVANPPEPGFLGRLFGDEHEKPKQVLAFYDARRNPLYLPEDSIGLNGSVLLEFSNQTLKVTYRSLQTQGAGYDERNAQVLLTEVFTSSGQSISVSLPASVAPGITLAVPGSNPRTWKTAP